MQSTNHKNINFIGKEVIRSSQLILPEDERGNRLAPRKKVQKSCEVLFDCGKTPMKANLIDISVTGCRLELSSTDATFDGFLLKVKSSGLERYFTVVWRSGNQIGATCIY